MVSNLFKLRPDTWFGTRDGTSASTGIDRQGIWLTGSIQFLSAETAVSSSFVFHESEC